MQAKMTLWTWVILAVGVLATSGCGAGDRENAVPVGGPDAQAPTQQFPAFSEGFVQFSFQSFGPHSNQSNTAYGGVIVTFNAPVGVYYYNCVVQSQTQEWQVKNVPLQGRGVSTSVFLPIDWTTVQGTTGTPVPVVTAGSLLSSVPLVNPPTAFTTQGVLPRNLNFDRGIEDGEWSLLLAPNQWPFALTPPFQNPVVQYGFHTIFVNQECGLQECVPASVSNSLKTIGVSPLSVGGGLPGGPLEIANMKFPTGWTPRGAPRRWFDLKAPSLLASHGVTTTTSAVPVGLGTLATNQRVTLVTTVLAAVVAGKDVEVQNAHHCAMVTAVRKIVYGGSVTIYIDVAHDTNQANPGGLVNETLQYDPATNLLWGGVPGYFPGTSPMFFTIEAKP